MAQTDRSRGESEFWHPSGGGRRSTWSLTDRACHVRSSSSPRSGRPAIFWQTQKTARSANPGARVPRRRALTEGFTIWVDTRERYPYRFAGREVRTERAAFPAGDYT